jgi:DNA-binding Xre family transcriptional regulator
MVQSRLKLVIAGEKPISIRDIADATGLAPSTITGLTANRSKGVTFDTVSALCDYFQVEPGALFLHTPDRSIE